MRGRRDAGTRKTRGRLKLRGLAEVESFLLCGPIERQIDPLAQGFGSQVRRLMATGNGFNDLWREERQTEQSSHVTRSDSLPQRDLFDRSCSTRRKPVEPSVCSRDGFEECLIGAARWRTVSFDDQPHLHTTAPDLNWDEARSSRRGLSFFTETLRMRSVAPPWRASRKVRLKKGSSLPSPRLSRRSSETSGSILARSLFPQTP